MPTTHPAGSQDAADREPTVTAPRPQRHDQLVVWGAHGGAGTTTLTTWLQPAWDMGAMRPEPRPRYPASVASGRPLIVTCRNTAFSTAQATKAVAIVTRQAGHVAVLVVISDGWPEPLTATGRLHLLGPRVGAVIRIPFIPGLRLADQPASVPLSRVARRALARIQAATGRTFPTS